ncbi:unnamed protein product [Cercospora beticola]|nr:unnamed protein product [Cercospora beticola]
MIAPNGQHNWLARAHGLTQSSPFLGLTPHDHTTAARDAWQRAQSPGMGAASTPIQRGYLAGSSDSFQVQDSYDSLMTPGVYGNQITANLQFALISTAASQGSSQSVKIEIPVGPALPSRHRPRHYCDIDSCQRLRKSFSRPSDLIRHQHAVHGQSSIRYLCSSRTCNYYCLRKDKMKEHCQRMHDQTRGDEQYGCEPYDGALEENPQWRWFLTHSI